MSPVTATTWLPGTKSTRVTLPVREDRDGAALAEGASIDDTDRTAAPGQRDHLAVGAERHPRRAGAFGANLQRPADPPGAVEVPDHHGAVRGSAV